MRVKICGITTPEDARLVSEAGADAIGLNFVPSSKRFITPSWAERIIQAMSVFTMRVGIFQDHPLGEVRNIAGKLRLDAVQLHGDEDADYARVLLPEFRVIKALSFSPELSLEYLRNFPANAILLDGLKPGSGEQFDWQAAAFLKACPNLILAGGLNPDNVSEGIQALRPYAVDVSSGVESSPGHKDARKVQRFLERARSA